MKVTISARHGEVPTSLRELAERRARRLGRYERRIDGAEFVFDQEGGSFVVETLVRVEGARLVVAQGAARSSRTALERACQRAARQLKRGRGRRRAHRESTNPEHLL